MTASDRGRVERPPVDRLRIGSRKSRLARHQAARVAERLRDRWPGLEAAVVPMTTEGDRVLDLPLPEIGGKGLFTAELEAALLEGRVDLAVHSLKDLPTDFPRGLGLIAVPGRADPRDVLVWPGGDGGVEDLPDGAVVGTSSLRRRAQLLSRRPDLRVRDVRGNVETRVRKCREGEYDALVLAAAGLLRLEMEAEITAWLEPPGWLPAPGQGALAAEGRTDDEEVRLAVEAVTDDRAEITTLAERSLLAELEGGCRTPLGASCAADGGTLVLHAAVLSPDGGDAVRGSETAQVPRGEPGEAREEARRLGRRLGRSLLRDGADRIIAGLEGR